MKQWRSGAAQPSLLRQALGGAAEQQSVAREQKLLETGNARRLTICQRAAPMTRDALFEMDGACFVPSELTRGPWDARAQHGGPPSALLARAIEQYEDGERMLAVRVTVELLRPVPLAPLTLRAAWVRPGKRVQLVVAALEASGVEVARAHGLRMRRAAVPLPDSALVELSPAPPSHDQANTQAASGLTPRDQVAFATDGVEHRVVAGGFHQLGPGTNWIRLKQPLLPGEPTSPLCRAVVAADFGNGLSAVVSRADGFTFVNPDLTVQLYREPVGEWICLDARSHVSQQGIGLAESALWDEAGRIGRSLQSLLIDKR